MYTDSLYMEICLLLFIFEMISFNLVFRCRMPHEPEQLDVEWLEIMQSPIDLLPPDHDTIVDIDSWKLPQL